MLLTTLVLAQVSVTPAHRMGDAWWKTRHEACVELTKQGGHELIFIGDSITQGWEGSGKAVWDQYYGSRKAANFGFSGDRTEHVLWRLENGEMVGLKPKVAVIIIGTNNLGHGSSDAAATVLGIRAILTKLNDVMPKTRILLLGIFPRGADTTDRYRQMCADTSGTIAGFANDRITYLDIGRHFLTRDGEMWRGLMPDLLHPNANGYAIWAKAMEPTLKSLLGE